MFIRYDYINSFILDYIAYSIHVSEVGGFYWYIIALQVIGYNAHFLSQSLVFCEPKTI